MAGAVFTGLVQTQGQLLGRSARGTGFRLSIGHDFGELLMGESIAVNGACLTVATFSAGRFEADCSSETAERTNLGIIQVGQSVHLERALRVGDRLGGHYVTGHIDAQVTVVERATRGESLELTFELPAAFRAYVATKGSVTLDGVSLTVNRSESQRFSVMVVPHTARSTRLGSLRRGDAVNFEVDVLARYVVHLAQVGREAEANSGANSEASTTSRDEALKHALAKAGML